MATLGIKGHPIRGREVIQLLEMLGGVNYFALEGTQTDGFYYVSKDNNKIYHCLSINLEYVIVYTLEEFEEKFPYKVGDKVIIENYKQIFEILSVRWCTERNIIMHQTSNGWYSVNDLQPYKEEIMEEPKELIIGFTKDENGDWILNVHKDYEIKEIEGKFKVIKKQPQYPKDYKECCKILNIPFGENIVYAGHWVYGGKYLEKHLDVLRKFQQLLICRDAYWKLAGTEMGLDKPWEPDWYNLSTPHEFIKIYKGCFIYSSRVLVFPTKAMRDVFYENFKKLIEQCKELL